MENDLDPEASWWMELVGGWQGKQETVLIMPVTQENYLHPPTFLSLLQTFHEPYRVILPYFPKADPSDHFQRRVSTNQFKADNSY